MLAKITLKNFRCFSDEEPVVFELTDGFTALIGPNNSGKSSLLRWPHELKRVLALLKGDHITALMMRGGDALADVQDVMDQAEIHFDGNRRPLGLTIEIEAAPNELARVEIERTTIEPSRWRARFFDSTRQAVKLDLVNHAPFIDRNIQLADGSALRCETMFNLIADLTSSVYISAFRNILSQSGENLYGMPMGSNFVTVWDSWKNGPIKKLNTRAAQIVTDIERLFEFKRLEINASQNKQTLQVTIDGRQFKLPELGAGLAQFVLTFVYVGMLDPPPSFVWIDEPETNLHPTLQADFLTGLASYAQRGVVFGTHSIGLARTMAERIFTLRKEGAFSTCHPLESTPRYAEFVGEMSFSSFKELGFEQILLVEGVTDVRTFQQFLRLLGKDHRVVIIPLGGGSFINGTRELELNELTRISKNVAAIIDSERTAVGAPLPEDRAGFKALCEKLEIPICVTDRRATENYLSDRAVKVVKGSDFSALGPFDLLKSSATPWAKSENWRIAREMKQAELVSTDVGQFLSALK